jgi:hypothetical protein
LCLDLFDFDAALSVRHLLLREVLN